MCIGVSAVYSNRTGKLYTSRSSMSHTDIKKENGIRDTNVELEELIDLELRPVGCLTDPEGVKDWELVVDNDGVEPDWWSEVADKVEEELRMWARIWCDGLTKWDGDLDLHDTNIKSLGSLKSVGGYLNLCGAKVTSLGSLESVGGGA